MGNQVWRTFVVFGLLLGLGLGATDLAEAALAPETVTLEGNVNCAGLIRLLPGPGTRQAGCAAQADFGSGGLGEASAQGGTWRFGNHHRVAFVVSARSIPDPITNLAPNVSVSAGSRGRFYLKARATNPAASAATVRLRLVITSVGGYTHAVGQTWGTFSGGVNGLSSPLFQYTSATLPVFGAVEFADLVPEPDGNPGTGDYLALEIFGSCSDVADRNVSAATCTVESNIFIEIDPDDPNVGDYEVALGPNPTDLLIEWADKSNLEWDAIPDTIGYDIVRGDLSDLRTSGGAFSTSTEMCEGTLVAGTSLPFVPDPTLPGDAWWFLGRAITGGGTGSWDSMGSGQAAFRDYEMSLSVNTCP